MQTARQLIEAATTNKKRRRQPTPELDVVGMEQQPMDCPSVGSFSEQSDGDSEDEQTTEFEIGTSEKGKVVLWNEGFRFIKTRQYKAKVYWHCEKSSKGCQVKAETTADDLTTGKIIPNKHPEAHNHLPKPVGAEAERRLNDFKNKVSSQPNIPVADLVVELKSNEISDELFMALPGEEALRHFAATKRRAFGNALNANDIANIQIPDQFRMKNGEPFMIYDSADHRLPDQKRVFVFASNQALGHLRTHKHWTADATFSACPRVYAQLFVIGFFNAHKMYPAIYALMPGKTKNCYVEVLAAVKNVVGEENAPETVMTDFEAGEISAIREVFPGVTMKGCLFHLAQSFFRRLRHSGLIRRFKDVAVRRAFRWTISLAFLPVDKVRRGFGLCIEQAPLGMEGFFFYIGKNYAPTGLGR